MATQSDFDWTFRIIHGSIDSVDLDVVYILNARRLPTFSKCSVFCSETKQENRNVITVAPDVDANLNTQHETNEPLLRGIAFECYKGLPDEINNSLYHTWQWHLEQNINSCKYITQNNTPDCPILRKITRIVPLKVSRAIRSLLTRVSKSHLRTSVKKALKAKSFSMQIEVLKSIDYTSDQIAKLYSIEDCKSTAFQLAQTIALIDGEELYSKGEISSKFPHLRPFMYRDPSILNHLYILNDLRNDLIGRFEHVTVSTWGDGFTQFYYNADKSNQQANQYQIQANGLIISLAMKPGERCIYFPPISLQQIPELQLQEEEYLVFAYQHQSKLYFHGAGLETNSPLYKSIQQEVSVICKQSSNDNSTSNTETSNDNCNPQSELSELFLELEGHTISLKWWYPLLIYNRPLGTVKLYPFYRSKLTNEVMKVQ